MAERDSKEARWYTWKQSIVYLLSVTCLLFFFIASRFASHCARPHQSAPSHSDCELSHGLVKYARGTGNNFISFNVVSSRLIISEHLLGIVPAHSQFELHTASVSIVLGSRGVISRANLPIGQSHSRTVDPYKYHTQQVGTMGNSSNSLSGQKKINKNKKKTIFELRAIVRTRRRETTFDSFIYSAVFLFSSSENVPNFAENFQLKGYDGNYMA